MRSLSLLFIFCFVFNVLMAQNFQWAKQFAGTGSPLNRALNFPRYITTDASGNVYTTGCFGGSVDFNPSAGAFPLATVSLSNTNVFISKLTACGDFIWAKSFAGLGDDQAFCVKIDNLGNVITSGHFSGTTDFDPGVGVFNLVGTANSPGFISKLDASGNFVWAKRINVITISATPDAVGDIYASGTFSGTVDFDPGVGVSNLTASGIEDMFVVKLDATGNFVWAKKIGNSTGRITGTRIAKKIFIDASSNLYSVASFSGTVDFDPGVGVSNLTATSSSDIVIVKLDALGTFIWAKRIGGGSTSSLYLNSVDLDVSGNSYFSGTFSGTVDFDPSLATFNLTSVGSAGGVDIFYAKIDVSGNLVWAKRTDVNATSFFLSIISIASDALGNAYLTGNFNGVVDFDPSPATTTLNTTTGDLFISTFDATGNFKGAANSSGLSMCIGTDNSGSAYIGSFFGGVTTDFDSGPGTSTLTISPADHADIAIIKFNAFTTTVTGPTTICSGSSASYSINTIPAATGYTWTVPSGAVINSGQNTPTINVTFGSSSGTISVTPSYTCISGGSSTTLAVTVIPSPTVNLSSVSLNTICIGGSAVIIPSGAITYTLMPGSLTGTSFTVSPTSTTTYTINGTNTSGCISTSLSNLKITIYVAPTPTIGLGSVSSATICSGNSSIITPSGASTYTLMPGSLTGTSFNVSPTSSSTYTISGTSSAGCVSSSASNLTVTINVSPTPVISAGPTRVLTCARTSTTLVGSGGGSYLWAGPGIVSGGTTANPTINLPGTYTVLVTATTGCTNTAVVTITQNTTTPVTSASTTGSVTCVTNTINLNSTLAGMNYTWTAPGGSSITSGVNTQSAIGNGLGTYTLLVLNPVNGCSVQATTAAIQNTIAPIGLSAGSNRTITCGAPSVTLAGSYTSPVGTTATWLGGVSGSSTSFTTTASSAGTFTLVGTNPTTGCSSTSTVMVTPSAGFPSAIANAVTNSITCTNTLVPISITSTSTPISILWTGPSITGSTTSASTAASAGGTYTVVVTNTVSLCSTSLTVIVPTNTTSPSVSISPSQSLTCGSPSVTISTTVSPSTDNTYSWSGPGIVGGTTSSSIGANAAGNYSVTVTNTLTGCTAIASSSVQSNSALPTLSVTSSSSVITCLAPTVTLTASSSSTSSIVWSSSTGTLSNPVNAVVSGIYTVSITDGVSGCTNTQTISVSGTTVAPMPTVAASVAIPCGASSTTLLATSTLTSGVSYTWFGPSVSSGSNTANPTVDQMGTYTVVLTDTVTGCSSTSTVDVTQGNVVAAFSADQSTGFAPLTVNFTDASVGATSYNWSFGNGSTSSTQNPNTVYTNSGTYTVMLIASSGPCTDTAYTTITVEDELYIPEIFSPNGDGKNDFFVIKGLKQYPNNKITIYNRWGNKVYEKEKYNNDWDGKPNVTTGTGSNVLTSGTYYVVFDKGNDEKPYTGYVQLQY